MTIVFGVIALLLGVLFAAPVLWTVGIILVAIGLILWRLGAVRHAAGPRTSFR